MLFQTSEEKLVLKIVSAVSFILKYLLWKMKILEFVSHRRILVEMSHQLVSCSQRVLWSDKHDKNICRQSETVKRKNRTYLFYILVTFLFCIFKIFRFALNRNKSAVTISLFITKFAEIFNCNSNEMFTEWNETIKSEEND